MNNKNLSKLIGQIREITDTIFNLAASRVNLHDGCVAPVNRSGLLKLVGALADLMDERIRPERAHTYIY
jgi:hypothetical protein